jgi:tetratricopeptide (TPR) repeat protein
MMRIRFATAWVAAALAACGSAPPADTPSSPRDDAAPAQARLLPSASNFEQRLRDRALSQGRQGRLAEAAVSWEILTVLRPELPEYRDRLGETRRLIASAVPERMQRGAQAYKRGELEVAATLYLAALALEPDQPQAAEALRQIERDRNKRSYLGKPSRITLTRRASTEAQMAAVASDRNELEHAAMLGTQGEFDDAIALLERQLATDRRDAAACQMLADMYFQKAEKQAGRDKPGAIASLEKSLRLDGSNTRAAARLRQLKNGASTVAPIAMTAPAHGCASVK